MLMRSVGRGVAVSGLYERGSGGVEADTVSAPVTGRHAVATRLRLQLVNVTEVRPTHEPRLRPGIVE